MRGSTELVRAPTADLVRARVLLIVDDPNQERIFSHLLFGCGCEVAAVRGEAGALERLARDTGFDALVVHLRVAAGADYAVCRRLRGEPVARALPLLLITAAEGEHEQTLPERAADAGADGLLSARQSLQAMARSLRLHLTRPPSEAAIVRARSARHLENLAEGYHEATRRMREREAELRAAHEEIARLRRENEELRGRLDQTEATNGDLGTFNDMVCHDLRNSLVSVASFSAFLQEDLSERIDDEHRVYLERLRRAGERALGLLSALRRLSLVNGRALRAEPVDLSAIAREVLMELHERDPDRRVDVRVEPDLRVVGDPELLWDLMHNLLNNAWKFTRDRARARIEFGAREADGERVFAVRDDGVGFEGGRAAEVFRPFTRLHARDRFEGNGIGLSTVDRIVRRHGGRVWAAASPDRGALFSFTLGTPPVR
jgi:signal transduction histidine kinase